MEKKQPEKSYIAIDLKSFYASVECVERGLDPLRSNLVVADRSRTDKTICLAVSPALKAYGIPGRPRLFEVEQAVKKINEERLKRAPGHEFTGESYLAEELEADPSLKLSYIAAVPRMRYYMDYSTDIVNIYQKYVSVEDIHVYSIDEVFIDVTSYLGIYHMSPHELAVTMIRDVLKTTGITATAGIGTNLYLSKIAMDIVAKKMPADADGVRIAELTERSYRELLWDHRPLTDFWRVGRGIARRLESHGIFTMGDIARCSLGRETDYYNEDLLYKMFGINAELLIDHAWGWEPVGIPEIHSYVPESNSISSGQVLHRPYEIAEARNVMREMADMLSLDLFEKGVVTDQLVLTIGYDIENLTDPKRSRNYKGPVTVDYLGRRIPKHAHGTANLDRFTSSSRIILDAFTALYDEITDPALLIRRINVTANRIFREEDAAGRSDSGQLSLFDLGEENMRRREEEEARLEEEKRLQEALLSVKKRFGKNAILRGMNYEKGATARDRNNQVGGHKA